MSKPDILIIDDEAAIRKLLEITLQSQDYTVISAASGREGLALVANRAPKLVLLDIGLPDLSGHEVLQELRQWYAGPVIILSVQNDEESVVKALDSGANDYLTKPFRSGELLARIRTALRTITDVNTVEPVYTFGLLKLDMQSRAVTKQDVPVKLTATEYDLLVLFVKNEGRVLTHPYILKTIWGAGYEEQTQYLRVFIGQLRKKIETDYNHPHHIVTESGVGYRFVS